MNLRKEARTWLHAGLLLVVLTAPGVLFGHFGTLAAILGSITVFAVFEFLVERNYPMDSPFMMSWTAIGLGLYWVGAAVGFELAGNTATEQVYLVGAALAVIGGIGATILFHPDGILGPSWDDVRGRADS